jgi:excisionase family DNA binding protein
MAEQLVTPRLALGASDAAKALSISERKLWSLTKSGEIPSFRAGKRVLYALTDLVGWIEVQKGARETG